MKSFKYLYILLSVVLGVTFLFSAYAKLYPIQLFESALVEGYFSTWGLAPYISRLIIAFEFAIGFLLITNQYFNKKLLKVVLATLILFTIHLVILLFTQGDSGNCMCFGAAIKMTPLESIYKNVVMLAITFLLYKKHSGISAKYKVVFLIVSVVTAILIPLVLNPPYNYIQSNPNEEIIGKHLDLKKIYELPGVEIPQVDLTKGKHVVAFLSLTCKHCKIAGYKMHVMKQQNPELPIYFFLNGDREDYDSFLSDTKCQNIPQSFLLGVQFAYRSGMRLPAIFFVENDTIKMQPLYVNLTQGLIEDWLEN